MLDPRTEKAKVKYEGKVFYTKEGTRQFKVNSFNSGSDIEIQFLNSDLIRHVSSYDMLTKGIVDPFKSTRYENTPTVYFEDAEKELMGNYYRTNEGYLIKVIKVDTKKRVTVKFQDEYGYEFTTTIQNIRKGEVKNPFHRNKFGGYLGVGPYTSKDKSYSIWYNMILRAHESNYYAYHHDYYTETYNNTTICDEWLCFNNFACWYYRSIASLNPNFDYEVDKDTMYPIYSQTTNGKKFYSPYTVSLMPHDLNTSIEAIFNFNPNSNLQSVLDRATYYYENNGITQQTYDTIKFLCSNNTKK